MNECAVILGKTGCSWQSSVSSTSAKLKWPVGRENNGLQIQWWLAIWANTRQQSEILKLKYVFFALKIIDFFCMNFLFKVAAMTLNDVAQNKLEPENLARKVGDDEDKRGDCTWRLGSCEYNNRDFPSLPSFSWLCFYMSIYKLWVRPRRPNYSHYVLL